jgi:hypothetical protein
MTNYCMIAAMSYVIVYVIQNKRTCTAGSSLRAADLISQKLTCMY